MLPIAALSTYRPERGRKRTCCGVCSACDAARSALATSLSLQSAVKNPASRSDSDESASNERLTRLAPPHLASHPALKGCRPRRRRVCNSHMGRHWWGTLLVGGLVLASCSSGQNVPTIASPAQSSCSHVSNLQVYPYNDGSGFTGFGLARAGPIWFSAFGPVTSGQATLSGFSPGTPTKVVIHADPTVKPPVVLTGIECSTGQALHFCYDQPDNCGLVGAKLTTEQLAERGFDHLTIDRARVDYTGYMLFPRSGMYRLSLKSGDHEMGSATVGVGQF